MGKKRKNRKVQILSTIIVLFIALIFGLFSNEAVYQNSTTTNLVTNQDITDNLEVYFIDVGQADSILIVNKDDAMLIDAGNNDDGEDVVNFIKEKGIQKLNYVVGTHPHEDHIGGLDDVINSFEVENVMLPDITTNTKTFEDVIESIENKDLEITLPQTGYSFKIGEANCEVKSTIIDKSNLNLASIVIRLEFGNTSFLLMGDAEEKNEEQMNLKPTTVLKVGHHGSTTSTSLDFLRQVNPQISVIMAGKDNNYGHPEQETLTKLDNIGSKIYRTDLNGTITIVSDGNKCEVQTER